MILAGGALVQLGSRSESRRNVSSKFSTEITIISMQVGPVLDSRTVILYKINILYNLFRSVAHHMDDDLQVSAAPRTHTSKLRLSTEY